MSWRTFKVGDKVKYSDNSFDGRFCFDAVITEVYDDYAIAECDGMHLWIEDFNEDLFSK